MKATVSRTGLNTTAPTNVCTITCLIRNLKGFMMKDVETAIGLVGSIKERVANLKEETKGAIISLASESCEVDMSGFHIRQSFSYYDEEVYHIDKAYIDPRKRIVRLQLYEYADSIDLKEFSVEDQIGICEYLHKVFTQPKQRYKIENA